MTMPVRQQDDCRRHVNGPGSVLVHFFATLFAVSFCIMEPGISVATYFVLLGPMCLILVLVLVGCLMGHRSQ